jgi:C4-dicarboxylate transporter, DctQ subunit
VRKTIEKLCHFEETVLAVSLLGLALLTFLETVLRYTFSYTFTWFQEFSNYMIVFTTFLGASVATKYVMHFSMEAITQFAPGRISHLLKAAGYLVSGAIVLLFVYFGTLHIMALKKFGVMSAAMQIPMFVPYIPIPLFSLVMSYRFFRLSYKHVRGFARNEPFEKVVRRDS